jgi:hypothetical protein
MVKRIQKARNRHEFEREEWLASDTLSGGGNKRGLGTNVGELGPRSEHGDNPAVGLPRSRIRASLSSTAGHAKATRDSSKKATGR